MSLNLPGIVVSMFHRLVASHSTNFDVDTNTLTVSVPDLGPRSLDVKCDEIEEFSAVISSYDPGATSQAERSLPEIVASSLTCEDGVVSFRCSDAKGSRAVKVPADQWSDFCRFWRAAAESVPETVQNYRDAIEKAEREAIEAFGPPLRK